jgi:mevalonate kinase
MRRFYAKILLFGEYSVIAGSDAMTLPHYKYSGCLSFPSGKMEEHQLNSNRILQAFHGYLLNIRIDENIRFDLDAFKNDLSNGLYFESSIPVHYGLGSSGALVAAVFDKYSFYDLGRLVPADLKELFSRAESFFHGKSSGVDPISVFMENLLVIDNLGIRKIRETANLNIRDCFCLLDTGIIAKTENFVSIFQNKLKEASYFEKFNKEYVPLINTTIRETTEFGSIKITGRMHTISSMQLHLFREMIPESMIQLWETGLASGEYYLKLCGSGGGGYLIVYSHLLPLHELNTLFKLPLEKI